MTPPTTTGPVPGDRPAIRVDGLRKRFGEVDALAGIELTVAPGTVLGLLGPNGAGKTTAVRILTTILRPDEGHAEVLGIDVARRPQAVRESIGLAGQYAAVDENLTGRENLRLVGRLTHLPTAAIGPRADELLERFGLTDAAHRPAKTYSGGMRRRLDLAAALVHRPPVLFLDEPTTGLDPASRSDLWHVIEELVADGTTVLLTTQYLEEADRLADHIAVIDHGRVIAEGSPSHLKSRLGGTIIDITLPDPASAARASAQLASALVVDARVDGSALELTVDDGARALVEVLRTLDAADLSPTGITVREPSLDDVFLSLTGHRAADGDTTASADTTQRGAA
ncbi:MAG: ATP-binding cassette domain-containing protein [Acidimicrobiales bacterium]|nr:ATP-binding cassette domain-containing protein [Acidimicrobiales bacterium]